MLNRTAMLNRITKDIWGFIFIFFLLLGFWLLISASFDWQHILVGAIIAFSLTFIWSETLFTKKGATGFSLKQIIQLFLYLACLILEIIKANFIVAYQVIHPKLPISPGFVSYKLDLNQDLSKTLFLNSITLTPGTIMVNCQGDQVIVHCFTRENADKVQEWYLYEQMKKLDSGGKNYGN